jgi:tRNA-dihydrouridine synthase B
MLEIGSLKLKNKVIYSPLAGCSDFPFRKISALYQPGLMFCEMVKMQPLVREHPVTLNMLDYSEEMRPIGGQIVGSDPKLAGPAAKIIEERGFDVVDFNCGCPVDKVTKDGSGSGMLQQPELLGEIISEMVAHVSIPVTVKIRVGWDHQSINAEEIVEIAERAGAKAIFVHGRTRQQGYKGPANWDYIAACKRRAKTIKVIGNGDVFAPEDALRMLNETGCDGVLVSRGTMGQPWIAEDIVRMLEGKEPLERTTKDAKEALLQHFAISSSYKNEKGALIDMRRVCCWYLKNAPGVKEIRSRAARGASLSEIRELIESFDV